MQCQQQPLLSKRSEVTAAGPKVVGCPCVDCLLTEPCCCRQSPDQSSFVQFGLFHGDPHPGNIFALADGRIAYVDFGNVAEVSQQNKQTLIDAVVHAVNEDYEEMAKDFIKLVCASTAWFML